MSQLRDEAEALAKALEFGVCDVAEVIAWSDAQFLLQDSSPASLCEVSLARGRYPQDVACMLRQCPGTPSQSNFGRLLVALLNDLLKADPDRSSGIASALFRMAMADEIEDSHLKEIAWWTRHALDFAETGEIEETREQVFGQMADALDQAATNAATSWSFKVGALGNTPGGPSA